jgi:DnaJ-class molecular chaperone
MTGAGYTCEACEGRGVITERRATGSGPYVPITRKCAECKGLGVIPFPGSEAAR